MAGTGRDAYGLAEGGSAVFVINTGDELVEREFALAALWITSPGLVHVWLEGETWAQPITALRVRLPSHDGALFLINPEPWTEIPKRLD